MNIAAWLLWLVPLVASPLVIVLSKIGRRAVEIFSCCVTFISFILSLVNSALYYHPSVEKITYWLPLMNLFIDIKIDGISTLLSVFISFLSFIIVLYSVGYMSHESSYTRYYSLILLFIGSMLGLIMAGNLVQLYFFWEMVGICSALLIAFYNMRESARRAGFKAFLVTRIGDGAFLIAIILTYVVAGSIELDAAISTLRDTSHFGNIAWIISLLFIIGAMAKSAQVPLHVWLPDAMEGPTPVSALIHAATMVNAGVYLLVRISPVLLELPNLLFLVQIIGLSSLLLAGLCAITSTDIKRVLAYSTISQIGLMFYAIGLKFWEGAIYHLISQGIFKALGFLAAGAILMMLGTGNIDELGGLKKYMKYTYLSFSIAVLTMSGFPPFIGFWSKDTILSKTINEGWILTIMIILSSLLTTIYGFRLLFRVFHGSAKTQKVPNDAPIIMLLPMLILILSTIASWPLLLIQKFINFEFTLHLEPVTIALSLVVLAIGVGLTFTINYKYKYTFDNIIAKSDTLLKLRSILLQGFGFDSIYQKIIDNTIPIIYNSVRRIQTGILNVNMTYIFVIIIVIIILFMGGIL